MSSPTDPPPPPSVHHTPQPQDHASDEDPLVRLEDMVQRVATLPELNMHVNVVREHFETVSPEDAAFGLDQLIRRSITGDLRAPDALLAGVMWLLREGSEEAAPEARATNRYDRIRELYRVASEQGRQLVTTFMLDLPPHKTAKILRQNVARLLKKDLSLGERKQLARGNNRQFLEALIYDTDPQVVQKLCANPAIREQDILRQNVARLLKKDLSLGERKQLARG
ncbi:MAG: hypothetical protein AAFS10_23850, partial [Myxococcota bacterium]